MGHTSRICFDRLGPGECSRLRAKPAPARPRRGTAAIAAARVWASPAPATATFCAPSVSRLKRTASFRILDHLEEVRPSREQRVVDVVGEHAGDRARVGRILVEGGQGGIVDGDRLVAHPRLAEATRVEGHDGVAPRQVGLHRRPVFRTHLPLQADAQDHTAGRGSGAMDVEQGNRERLVTKHVLVDRGGAEPGASSRPPTGRPAFAGSGPPGRAAPIVGPGSFRPRAHVPDDLLQRPPGEVDAHLSRARATQIVRRQGGDGIEADPLGPAAPAVEEREGRGLVLGRVLVAVVALGQGDPVAVAEALDRVL